MIARPTSTLSALRYGESRLLFGGLVAANLGAWMQEFALGWLVVQLAVRDGNPALAGFYLGLRSLAGAVPALAFGLFAGVYADRTDRRRLLILSRIASALSSAAYARVPPKPIASRPPHSRRRTLRTGSTDCS